MSSGKRKECMVVSFWRVNGSREQKKVTAVRYTSLTRMSDYYIYLLVEPDDQPQVFQSCSLQAATAQSRYTLRLSLAYESDSEVM